jgi:preprotein translocase subunit YajC
MFNSIAYAADAAAPAGGNPIQAFLPLIFIFAIFYFLLIRPQQKRQKQHNAMLNALKAGDEVVVGGGIFGVIDKVLDQNTFVVEIANGVKITVAKSGVNAQAAAGKVVEEKK